MYSIIWFYERQWVGNKLEGMSVNERLYVSGLMDEFDKAVKERNISTVILVLKKVELTANYKMRAILEHFGLVV